MSFYEGKRAKMRGIPPKRVHGSPWVRQKNPQKADPGATGDCGFGGFRCRRSSGFAAWYAGAGWRGPASARRCGDRRCSDSNGTSRQLSLHSRGGGAEGISVGRKASRGCGAVLYSEVISFRAIMQPEKTPHTRLEVMKVQSANMSFAIMDEKQGSDRALETICVQDLPRSWAGHRHCP